MQDSENMAVGLVFSQEIYLLWIAVLLAVSFLGLLVFDFIRRRKRLRHRRRRESRSLRTKVFKLVHRARAFKNDLKRMFHHRSRRKHRETPL